tara:strand:- start:15077 stop:15220 length:144 start_codon:yes stop_codon:yes gene_type:complete
MIDRRAAGMSAANTISIVFGVTSLLRFPLHYLKLIPFRVKQGLRFVD